MKEVLALAVLAACLVAAIARPARAPEWAVTAAGAILLLLTGTVRARDLHADLRQLGPTIGFLAALLVLSEACAAAGLFEALGAQMASGSRRSGRRLLAMVFIAATGTTAVLSLDATVLLLTPIVLVTARGLRVPPRPHLLACTHLANSASLLLPISNLTNLLAFQASGLAFARFGAVMLLPWTIALTVEWQVLRRAFAAELTDPVPPAASSPPRARVSRTAVAVLALTLIGLGLSSTVGASPAWIAAAGALVMARHQRLSPAHLARAAQPLFLLFVLALGLVVHAAGRHGLSAAVGSLLPSGQALPDLLAFATVSAVFSNLVNNLPATLIVLPVAAAAGTGPVLAMLVGVNVGPNLTYVGSLATLLWRRVLRDHGESVDGRLFLRLGLMVVPAILLTATTALWLALQVLG